MKVSWGFAAFGQQFEIDGKSYLPIAEVIETRYMGDSVEIDFDTMEERNKCLTCHRSDLIRPVTAYGWADAIERRLLIPLREMHKWPGPCPGCSNDPDHPQGCIRTSAA